MTDQSPKHRRISKSVERRQTTPGRNPEDPEARRRRLKYISDRRARGKEGRRG